MKTTKLLMLGSIIIATVGCASNDITSQQLAERRARYEQSIGSIILGEVESYNSTHAEIFQLVQRLAKENDPSGIGIDIVIPQAYRQRYKESLKDQPVTMSLGPRLTMKQFMVEFPFDDWRLCYWDNHTVVLIPMDAVNWEAQLLK